ncbi:MAG: amidohydrolase family protein [Candidatus Korobacteraceae bacterium]|jgi:2,3-dihydroxybenzoate decarboxylase
MDTISEVGADRILFAADYPFETMTEASDWFDNLEVISAEEQLKIGQTNAEKLLKLKTRRETVASS